MLQPHVVDGRQADARPEDVFDAGALLEERVDDGRAAGDEGRLAEVAQHREHWVEAVVGAAGNAERVKEKDVVEMKKKDPRHPEDD